MLAESRAIIDGGRTPHHVQRELAQPQYDACHSKRARAVRHPEIVNRNLLADVTVSTS